MNFEIKSKVGIIYILDTDGKYYEADSCSEVWTEVYKVLYKKSKVNEFFDFDNLDIENKQEWEFDKYRRLYKCKEEYKRPLARFLLGGETDFDFKPPSGIEKYCINNKISNETKNRIYELLRHKYTKKNFSVMLAVGGSGCLNNTKGSKCKMFGVGDNICKFIYKLDKVI